MATTYNRYANDPLTPEKFGYTYNTDSNAVSAYKPVDTNAAGYTDPEHQRIAAELNGGAPATDAGGQSSLEKAQADYYNGLNRSMPDENAIRQQTRDRMQAQIDAIDKEYASIFSQEDIAAQGRMGQTRAINAQSGNMGSDIGAANMDGTSAQNLRVRAALEAEKSQKIQSVYAKIDQSARDEIKAKKEEALGNAKAYIDYLQTQQDTSREGIKTLAAGGVSLDQLSTDQYQKLLKGSGLDDFTFKAYYNENKPAGQKIDYKYEIKDGKMIAYGIDPATNKPVMISSDLPAGYPTGTTNGSYKTQFAPNGQLLLIPENFDPSKSLDSQIIKAGNYAKPTDHSSDTEYSQVADALASLKGAEGYVDPQAYRDMYAEYIRNNPGKGDSFTKNFPVSIYIDPSNQWQFSK